MHSLVSMMTQLTRTEELDSETIRTAGTFDLL